MVRPPKPQLAQNSRKKRAIRTQHSSELESVLSAENDLKKGLDPVFLTSKLQQIAVFRESKRNKNRILAFLDLNLILARFRVHGIAFDSIPQYFVQLADVFAVIHGIASHLLPTPYKPTTTLILVEKEEFQGLPKEFWIHSTLLTARSLIRRTHAALSSVTCVSIEEEPWASVGLKVDMHREEVGRLRVVNFMVYVDNIPKIVKRTSEAMKMPFNDEREIRSHFGTFQAPLPLTTLAERVSTSYKTGNVNPQATIIELGGYLFLPLPPQSRVILLGILDMRIIYE
ncbi:hypothetical protein F5877DRAFT_70873 [Lentinula edodes]|nr:hypothetical protein F5877DRAFT_70873 [Lentinula edodes]